MARSPKPRRRRPPRGEDSAYEIVIRAQGGRRIPLRITDRALYPQAVVWNEWFVANRKSRVVPPDASKRAHDTLVGIGIDGRALDDLFSDAVESGVVQVESSWAGDEAGYAVWLFPWEQLLLLAARPRRGERAFTVVRWLRDVQQRGAPATGAAVVVTTRDALDAGFGVDSECAVVRAGLAMPPVGEDPAGAGLSVVASAEELRACLAHGEPAPAIVHFMLRSVDRGIVYDERDRRRAFGERMPAAPEPVAEVDVPKPARKGAIDEDRRRSDELAACLASRRPRLVSLSSCYTGRRLAPRVVAAGADAVVAFHHEVEDENLPAFFGVLYDRLEHGEGIVGALRAALKFNKSQPLHEGLGAVTLWSPTDLLVAPPAPRHAARKRAHAADAASRILIDCALEEAINYSVLHNSRGGLFRRFVATELGSPSALPLSVEVRLDTGDQRPAECRFVCRAPRTPFARVDLGQRVTLPLGAELLRQRRETTRAAVEIVVSQGAEKIHHETMAIPVLPADEWRDDRSGTHFLPSFIFPRDAAVRDLISAAHPFLRALGDQVDVGFDGYQRAADAAGIAPVEGQVRAIWCALQHGYRIDYANPPPAHLRSSQRLRTPGEILRARRATCVETALLLAACWEHVGLDPVLFLTPGHAFCGYWAEEDARGAFLERIALLPADGRRSGDGRSETLGGVSRRRQMTAPWMFAERLHLEAIVDEVARRRLVPVEATGAAKMFGYRESVEQGRRCLDRLRIGEFDGMLDVRTARSLGVTPLPIVAEGPVA